MALAIKKNLEVMDALGDTHDVPYLSPSDVHFKDEWFLDGYHLNEEGERAKAHWILTGVIRLLAADP